MIKLAFEKKTEGIKILCIGAHCDDIEIGCGGTLLKLFEQYPIVDLHWIVFASNERRAKEAILSANLFLESIPKKEISIFSYRDAFLQFSALEIKEEFEGIKQKIDPDIIFTHRRADRHQDHRLLAEYTWNTFRNHMIWEYEIPKYEGDLGHPNMYVHLDEKWVHKKINILLESFRSQSGKHWFDHETFKSLMRLRGIESAAPSRYAEAFHVHKAII